MSAHTRITRKTVTAIRSTKGIGSLVSLTAYSAPMAKLVDEVADVIIVGDSVGMVLYGMPDTLRVTLDMMIAHGAAVVRGAAPRRRASSSTCRSPRSRNRPRKPIAPPRGCSPKPARRP
ncbi:3-methyl-2-oxobutanoate hydroxymethyltransferase [Burkholderia cenocepacia]|nr:3-methyl-2-oxobutanoate hydroxymethyltransferase [Burkholderia cenocepacia]